MTQCDKGPQNDPARGSIPNDRNQVDAQLQGLSRLFQAFFTSKTQQLKAEIFVQPSGFLT